MIEHIAITGYKSLRSVNVVVKSLNVLVGANASGKSSFLQTLLLLRQSANSEGIVGKLKLAGSLYEAGTVQDVLHPEAGHKIQVGIASEDGRFLLVAERDREAERSGPGRFMLVPHPVTLPLALVNKNDLFSYLNAERIGPRIMYSLPSDDGGLAGPVGKFGEYATAVLARSKAIGSIDGWPNQDERSDDNPYIRHLAEAVLSLDNMDIREALINSGGRLDRLVNIFLNWIIPGSSFVAEEHGQSDTASLHYVRDLKETKTEVRATHIGFGLTYALPIIVAAFNLKQGGILIVENPEAHLHPFSQSRMGAFLSIISSLKRQVFVETHSDHFVNGVRLAVRCSILAPEDVKFSYFKKSEIDESTVVTQIDTNTEGRLSKWPEGFFDQIDNDLSRL